MNTMDFLSPSMVNTGGHQQLGQLDGVGGEDRHCRHPTHRGDGDFEGDLVGFSMEFDFISIGFSGCDFNWI
jgi:hypothetical protein